MKRIILLAALLLAASACNTTTQAPGNANATATPANANTSATPKAEGTTTATDSAATAQEKQIWDAIKQKDSAGFAAMLAEDFIYVSSDGVHDKAGTVDGIKMLDATDITLSDWKAVSLNKDAAVVTYVVNMKGTSGGQPILPASMRGGSVWVNRGGKWVGVFHQDTPVEEPPAMDNKTSDKPAAKPTPAAESKPAEAVSDDPIAREKQVWDAIKKKDYDRFASYLAEDQMEVFGWGVNDKAASVKGVQQADLGGAVLSDFKTLKIADDASIVTYTIKGPKVIGPNGTRGSTVWVKRDGKWLAIYHQDTPIQPATAKK
jgi:hypothetical protein